MNDLFRLKDWLIFNQPSQSPVTNIHDTCIFPMMSKAVSTEQALTFGSKMLVGEQLNESVMKVWNDQKNIVAMSRSFAGHSQIVCSILEHKGDNKYLSEKGGLSFGVRRSYICDKDGEGVTPITLAPENLAETTQGLILSSNFDRGMKYTPPDIRTLKNGRLTNEMMEILNMYIDTDLMDDEIHEFWCREVEMLSVEHDEDMSEYDTQPEQNEELTVTNTVHDEVGTTNNDTHMQQM